MRQMNTKVGPKISQRPSKVTRKNSLEALYYSERFNPGEQCGEKPGNVDHRKAEPPLDHVQNTGDDNEGYSSGREPNSKEDKDEGDQSEMSDLAEHSGDEAASNAPDDASWMPREEAFPRWTRPEARPAAPLHNHRYLKRNIVVANLGKSAMVMSDSDPVNVLQVGGHGAPPLIWEVRPGTTPLSSGDGRHRKCVCLRKGRRSQVMTST